MSPAEAVRLGESLQGLQSALMRVAALLAEHGPPLREIVVSSILPSGLRFSTPPGSEIDLSFLVISPTEWEQVERAAMANDAYLKAAAMGCAPVTFQGVPVFDMDRADSGKAGVAAAARAESIRHTIAQHVADTLMKKAPGANPGPPALDQQTGCPRSKVSLHARGSSATTRTDFGIRAGQAAGPAVRARDRSPAR